MFKVDIPYTIIESDIQSSAVEIDNGEKYEYEANIRVLNVFPVKSTKVTVSQRRYVYYGGSVFGLKIYTNGVVVVKIDEVSTEKGSKNPAAEAGLIIGDTIKKIDGKPVGKNDDVSAAIEGSKGKKLTLTVERNGKTLTLTLTPALSLADGKYRAGLWVRDSSAGIGTLTFYDSKTKVFAGLGHAVCDVDTGRKLPISGGDALKANINGCYKGTDGSPGELCGTFTSSQIGSLNINDNTGIYGICINGSLITKQIPVALTGEVKQGKAQIVSTIDENGPQYYDIEITKLYSDSSSVEKNMVIKVTDEELIRKTGGIVQGMSGSPIIQNGMLVGAVTHVFVNSPLQGYAIYSQTMLETADSLFYSHQKLAS
ncbi:MAG: SpoIVB peptidase [Clostridiales bacterium]|nr:SpoIVB peptidase [Clostridiales bacterium]